MKLTRSFAARPLPVRADPAQLQQLLMNLLQNAGEALEAGSGTIALGTGEATVLPGEQFEGATSSPLQPGRYATLWVTDDGRGMDKAVRARLFEPFFSTKFAGRGLGLPAVLGIVRGHGGAIQVESAAGAGSTFRIFLPLEPEETASVPGETAQPERRLLLVVDDEPGVRRAARRMLEAVGYRVEEAGTGAEGVALLRARGAEVTAELLDLTMPGLSGRQALDELRALRPELPVVLCSGYDADEEIQALSATGCTRFVGKPYRIAELAAALDAVVAAARDRPAGI